MKINACCTSDPAVALCKCDSAIYCGESESADKRIKKFVVFSDLSKGDIYVPTLDADDVPEALADYIISENAKAIVRAAYDLNEAGRIEARYKLSPIMLLHKLGVLSSCIIVGGVCLDNDDLDLMAQEGVPLVITPTASAGYGFGYAPVSAALRRGIKVGVGTLDGKYNKSHDLDYETEFMRLMSNAEMRKENALSDNDVAKILAFE